MCMMLSMTMGMSIGLKRTFWMMWGELLGVAIVAIASVVGIATIMLEYPSAFNLLKYIGGVYLVYLGIQLWRSKGKMAFNLEGETQSTDRINLAMQGFITAIANPKGWAFFISLLPPFINPDLPLAPQLVLLLSMILVIEFLCLILYASGGKTLSKLLQKSGNVRLLNRISGSLMMGVGIWLALG
ncbi:LysE family translocator [Zooshikella marina]|uniref:LysE family translocator n=2 Tax=Zooshikella ganghwensis TaxID=202772 RepID=A0A4P9VXN7_9GAMM|nr:LysE family translocator [Zooshikella ganghwensis]RDH46690.1 LysE family translocator [Zooshikella ganghwensis]